MEAKEKRQNSLFFGCFLSLHSSREAGPPYLLRICLFLRKIFTLTAVLPHHIVLNQEGHFKDKTAPRLARSS